MKKPTPISSRILRYVGGMLLGSFVLISLVFNTVMSSSIDATAITALENAQRFVEDGERADPSRDFSNQTQILLVTGQYILLDNKPVPDLPTTISRTQLVLALKDAEVDLSARGIKTLSLDNRKIYYAVLPNPRAANQYFVLYIDMVALNHLQFQINLILWIVMALSLGIALVVSRWMAKSIAKPIQAVQRFAQRIGHGDTTNEYVTYDDLELHQLNASMNTMVNQLVAKDAAQRTFFQNVSHELRTPLQIIKTQTEAIEAGVYPVEQAAPIIHREIDDLRSMIDDVLMLSRLESQSTELPKLPLDLREIMERAAERLRLVANQHHLELVYDFDETAVTVEGDEASFLKVFNNLVSNALRYAKTTVTLRAHKDHDRIILMVEDDGKGIDPQRLPHLFERFYTDEHGHYGIGLSIVKSITEAYGGRVEASSEPHQTRFILYF